MAAELTEFSELRELEGDVLTISGEHKEEKEEKTD